MIFRSLNKYLKTTFKKRTCEVKCVLAQFSFFNLHENALTYIKDESRATLFGE